MGIARRRGRMRDAGSAYYPGRQTVLLGDFENCRQGVIGNLCMIAPGNVTVYSNEAITGFHTGHHGGHGWCGIRGLLVHAVGFGQRHKRKCFEAKLVFFTVFPPHLSFQDTCCGGGGDAHAIPHKQDDVFGQAKIERQLLRLLDTRWPF